MSDDKDDRLLIIGGDEGKSLQDSFSKFLQQKRMERKLMKNHSHTPRSEEYKQALREKFIETAKKYIGVPYAAKYAPPDEPPAPLYLDCCGLVRHVVKELQEDFGFIIGKWNQAYQFDTLPIVLKEEEMKPGDLVFYEGTFTSNRSKRQKHNMVHVEIYLGNGSTIGARYQRGTVQIFPSYQFSSTLWTLDAYHFRSLDTWLDGHCASHCDEHPWVTDASILDMAAGSKSIFNMSDDESAGDDDFGDADDIQQSTNEPVAPAEALEMVVADDIENAAQNSIDDAPLVKKEPKKRRPRNTTESAEMTDKRESSISPEPRLQQKPVNRRALSKASSSDVTDNAKVLPPTYYVLKSNGWQMVKASLDKRGWQQLPFEYNFSSRYALKWVERRSQIDYKAHTSGQLANHIPNNDVITTKLGLYHTIREHFAPNLTSDAEKIALPWIPETYQLDLLTDSTILLQLNETEVAAEKQSLWIYKPSSSNRGRGVYVLRNGNALKQLIYEHNPSLNPSPPPVSPYAQVKPQGIVQRYILNPLLTENYKFDIRCYMLIASNDPYKVYYHPGYCRRTLKPYSDDLATIQDPLIHLTNAAIQKKHPEYDTQKEEQIQLPAVLAAKMERDGDSLSAEYMRSQLDTDIMKCMLDVLKASKSKFQRKKGFFDLLGFDFMITAAPENKLVLLEVNTNPAMSRDNSTLQELLPNVIDGTIELVLSAQQSSWNKREDYEVKTYAPNDPLPSQFVLLYDEEVHFEKSF